MGEIALAGAAHLAADLATLALTCWSDDQAKALDTDPREAIGLIEKRFTPARQEEPKPGPKARRLMKALAEIGVKIAPTMPQDRAEVWCAVMVKALSDLPFAFSIRGAEDALKKPMQFMNEVEGIVREQAEIARQRHLNAIHRLRRFQREIDNADKPKLTAPEVPPLTQEGINAMPLELRKIGLTLGHLTQEQFDAAATKDEPDAS